MREVLFRCSSLGKIMTEPKSKSEVLSVGAKTYIRSLVAQEIFGVDFEVTSKEMNKGIECEGDAIQLLNRVRGLDLAKNTERKSNGFVTGEADLFDAPKRCGHDLKVSWSIATFPLLATDAEDKLYEWQMRGYMWLWDADEWEVNYCLLSTPEHLMRYELPSLHFVDHIPEHLRLTTWTVKRDKSIEETMAEKVTHARAYYAQVMEEFVSTHKEQV
jgi:hypothetical protein